MQESQDKFVIQLLIGKQLHAITVRRDQEAVYRKAASIINSKLGRYEQSYPNLSNERYMSVALLDFAVQVIQLQNEQDTTPLTDTIDRLAADIDQALRGE